jgi:probable HAF family extracellular repeat protein
MVGLGDLPGGDFVSNAQATSADGSVVVGFSKPDPRYEAFRWTADGGMVGLGYLPGGDRSMAYSVSADGSIVVGATTSTSAPDPLVWKAFMWDPVHGMRDVESVLTEDFGLDLTGWKLTEARDVSGDGTVIVGYGTNPSGDTEAWIAVVPEPAALSLLVLGGLAVTRRRRREVVGRN